MGLLGPRFLGHHVSIIRVLIRVFFFLGLGSWVSDFWVQDFGSKILWAFSFLVQGVFLVLSFCVPDFWVLGSLCHRLLGSRFF